MQDGHLTKRTSVPQDEVGMNVLTSRALSFQDCRLRSSISDTTLNRVQLEMYDLWFASLHATCSVSSHAVKPRALQRRACVDDHPWRQRRGLSCARTYTCRLSREFFRKATTQEDRVDERTLPLRSYVVTMTANQSFIDTRWPFFSSPVSSRKIPPQTKMLLNLIKSGYTAKRLDKPSPCGNQVTDCTDRWRSMVFLQTPE